MSFGLSEELLESIRQVFAAHSKIDRVLIYGSRAKGNFRTGSDIDLTMIGPELDIVEMLKIENELDDLLLPYKFDLSIYEKITDSEVRQHIERVGKIFYQP